MAFLRFNIAIPPTINISRRREKHRTEVNVYEQEVDARAGAVAGADSSFLKRARPRRKASKERPTISRSNVSPISLFSIRSGAAACLFIRNTEKGRQTLHRSIIFPQIRFRRPAGTSLCARPMAQRDRNGAGTATAPLGPCAFDATAPPGAAHTPLAP